MQRGGINYWFAALIWTGIILVALLLPSPRGWGEIGEWLGPKYARIEHIVQPTVHILFMAVLGLLLMKCLERKPLVSRVLITLMATMVVAVFFEASQSLLPKRFCRASDPGDLIYSAIGAGVGCFLALMVRALSGKLRIPDSDS